MRLSGLLTPLLVAISPWLAYGQAQIPIHNPRMRMALKWVREGWSEQATLCFTNLLLAGNSLSPENREVLNVLIEQPTLRFQFRTRFNGLITVPERTPVSLRYLRLVRQPPACEILWSGSEPDLPKLAELELVDPQTRGRVRAFLAERILQIQARPGGATALPALVRSLRSQLAGLEGNAILHRGARQLLLSAFQLADDYTEGRFPRHLYLWLGARQQEDCATAQMISLNGCEMHFQ